MRLEVGFTLLELMIAVAIVAILSALAYPSYQSYVGRGYRAEAHTALHVSRIYKSSTTSIRGSMRRTLHF